MTTDTKITGELDYASVRWFDKQNSKANRFVLQLRRHVEDQGLSLARILRATPMKAGARWSDAS